MKTLPKISVFVASLLGCAFWAGVARADVITMQASGASTTIMSIQPYGYGDMLVYVGQLGSLASQLGSYQIELQAIDAAASNAYSKIFECTSAKTSAASIFSTCTNKYASSSIAIRTSHYVTFVPDSPIVLTAGYYYYLDIQRSADNHESGVYGADSSSTVISNFSPNAAYCTNGYDGTASNCGGFIPYFVMNSDSGTSSNPLGSGAFGFPSTASANISGLGFGSVFGGWNVLQQKFPLNWVFDSYAIFLTLQNSTTTVAIPEASEDFSSMNLQVLQRGLPGATSTGQWKVTYFGSSTIAAVGSLPHWPDLRLLSSWMLYIGLIVFVWNIKGQLIPR